MIIRACHRNQYYFTLTHTRLSQLPNHTFPTRSPSPQTQPHNVSKFLANIISYDENGYSTRAAAFEAETILLLASLVKSVDCWTDTVPVPLNGHWTCEVVSKRRDVDKRGNREWEEKEEDACFRLCNERVMMK